MCRSLLLKNAVPHSGSHGARHSESCSNLATFVASEVSSTFALLYKAANHCGQFQSRPIVQDTTGLTSWK